MKQTAAITVILSFCLSLLFCSDECGNTITYRVEGTASEVIVLFNNEYGDPERYPISLPWVKKFNVRHRGAEYHGGNYEGDFYPALVEATIVGNMGTVNVAILVNGKLVAADTSTATKPSASAYRAVRL